MTDYEWMEFQALIKLQIIARRILLGESCIPKKFRETIKTYVQRNGLNGIFRIESSKEVDSVDNEVFDDDSLLHTILDLDINDKDIAKGDLNLGEDNTQKQSTERPAYMEISELTSYLSNKLLKARTINDLIQILNVCLAIVPSYEDKGKPYLLNQLLSFIGDLYFVSKQYDEAITTYSKVYKNCDPSEIWRTTIPLLNAYYKARKQPPVELMFHCGWAGHNINDLLAKSGDYLMRRYTAECVQHENDFFGWALSQGNDRSNYSIGVFSYVVNDVDSIWNRFKMGPFIAFTELKAVCDFATQVRAEINAILRFSNEFNDRNQILHQWYEKFDWYDAFLSMSPKEEITFAYHTPWLWKFNLDLYFPRRNLAIVFHRPDNIDETAYVHGASGKVQLIKEWRRAITKAEKKYGIHVCYVPVYHSKTNLVELIRRCEVGEFSF